MIDLPREHLGPSPAKVRFFAEMRMAMQFMELYHSLPKDAQAELMETVRSFTAQAYGHAYGEANRRAK